MKFYMTKDDFFLKKSLICYERSALNKSAEGLVKLGELYLKGMGVK